jgi:membrane fusion protein (multidrug efflux system)
MWIEANFKEVQLKHMRIGQPVKVTSDLYGGHVEYQGRVQGLGMGTGAAFALLPAQNATGNWIKVVQRVPVRVTLDPKQLEAHPLRIGLSIDATVDVHDSSGEQLAQTAPQKPILATNTFDIDRSEIKSRIEEIIRQNTREGTAPSDAGP